MSRPCSTSSSFNYDSLGEIQLFYVPTPPPAAVLAEATPLSRWSVDTEELAEIRREATRLAQRSQQFWALKAAAPQHLSIPLPAPVTTATKPVTPVQQIWGALWAFAQRLWSFVPK